MRENNSNEKLFDTLIKIASEEALMEEMQSCEDLNEQHKPSRALDKRIRKIISRNKFKESAFIWRKTAVRIAASVAMVLAFSSAILFSVEATRNFIFNAIIKWQEDYFSLEHNDIITENPIVYKPEYLPKGFKEISSNVIGEIAKINYENENDIRIGFQQSPSQSSHILADYEDKTYTVISINRQEAYLFNTTDNDKNNTVLWESNGTIFNISSELDSTELILMAESIKK